MRLKIRCDEESEKFCKIFWELNKAKAAPGCLCAHQRHEDGHSASASMPRNFFQHRTGTHSE